MAATRSRIDSKRTHMTRASSKSSPSKPALPAGRAGPQGTRVTPQAGDKRAPDIALEARSRAAPWRYLRARHPSGQATLWIGDQCFGRR
jgi:hypothetical protein